MLFMQINLNIISIPIWFSFNLDKKTKLFNFKIESFAQPRFCKGLLNQPYLNEYFYNWSLWVKNWTFRACWVHQWIQHPHLLCSSPVSLTVTDTSLNSRKSFCAHKLALRISIFKFILKACVGYLHTDFSSPIGIFKMVSLVG